MTWTNNRCAALGPAGEQCALPAGHGGDHAASTTGVVQSVGRTPAGTSLARIAATPIALLVLGAALGFLIGPMYLWFLGAGAVAILYVLVATRR